MADNQDIYTDQQNKEAPMKQHDIVIIGGGPAGLAAAVEAKRSGVEDILVVERDNQLGGILNQCIHNGFGLHTFREELTGPEYAQRFISQAEQEHISTLLDTIVIDISVTSEEDGAYKVITAMNKKQGIIQFQTKAVVLAMGCRERSRGALNIPGYRPAGIYSAGTAQRYVNIEGKLPGKEVVILGSGDIGLIMARRMTLEGAKVKVVAELMPYSGGLRRNIVQCLDDFNIPLKLSHTVIDIQGKERVEGITLAQVDDKGRPIDGTEEHISCDTLLLSVGLIPENELSVQAGVEINPVTNGPIVNESLETSISGIFACGNVLHVHDLVDYVSQEAAMAGKEAAAYVKGALSQGSKEIILKGEQGVRYTVPARISIDRMDANQIVRFRVGRVYTNARITAYTGDYKLLDMKRRIMAPGEMEQIQLKKDTLEKLQEQHILTDEIIIKIESEV